MPRSREPLLIQHDRLPINLHLLRVFVVLGNYARVQLDENKWHQKARQNSQSYIRHLTTWPVRFSPGAKLIRIGLKPESNAAVSGSVAGERYLSARANSEGSQSV